MNVVSGSDQILRIRERLGEPKVAATRAWPGTRRKTSQSDRPHSCSRVALIQSHITVAPTLYARGAS